MHFNIFFIYASLCNLSLPSVIGKVVEDTWMRDRYEPIKSVVKVSCYATAPPCRGSYKLTGFYIEEGEICHNQASINLSETCYSGKYNKELVPHYQFSLFGGIRYKRCKDEPLYDISIIGFKQVKNKAFTLQINTINAELVTYARPKDGFYGLVYVVNTTYCPSEVESESIINKQVGLTIKPLCTDGVLVYKNSECKVVVKEQEFIMPSCGKVVLPTYDDKINVCDSTGCHSVSCTASDVCVVYDKMDSIMKIKNYHCSDTYIKSVYIIIVLVILIICIGTITIINILCFLRPAFWLCKKILFTITGLCHYQPAIQEVEVDLSTIRVIQDEDDHLIAIEDSIAPNTNLPSKSMTKARKMENGLLYIPMILFFCIAPMTESACQDLVSSLSNIEVCHDGQCGYNTKVQLSLMNTPQDFCFKTKSDVYKIRFNFLKVKCLSTPEYYTNSYSREIAKSDWKCFEGEGCPVDGSYSIWDKSDTLSYDYCVKEFVFFSYCPATHYNWKRIVYKAISSRPCVVRTCNSFKFEIQGYVQKNGVILSELSGFADKYISKIVDISLLSFNTMNMPKTYVECDNKAYIRAANDLGSFNKELLGHIQCPTREDALTLTRKCVTKVVTEEDQPMIRYEEKDGLNMLEYVGSKPLIGVAVTPDGLSLDTNDVLPVTLSLKIKEPITSLITSTIKLNSTTCKITGVERKFKKTKVRVDLHSKSSISDILSCSGLALCSLTINNEQYGECITTSYHSTDQGSSIRCLLMYSGIPIQCTYNVSPLEITVVAPSLDFNSMEAVKESTTNWMNLIASIIRDNPKLTLMASILPIGMIIKTIKGFLTDIRQD
uniref:Pvc2 n=1 Tax=Maize stripe virus TaxID=3052767 RepID=A0A8G0VI71_MSTV|nr:pvc2 [Tenuivirus zeae]